MAQATNDFNGVITLLAGAVVGVAITFGAMNGMNTNPRLPSELTPMDATMICDFKVECVQQMIKDGHARLLSPELFTAPAPSYPGAVSNPLPTYYQPLPATPNVHYRDEVQTTTVYDHGYPAGSASCAIVERTPVEVRDPDKN